MNTWSPNQQAAIYSRGQNVIVSAGAGSGKTSVLVERVIRCVVDEPMVDLNRLLVVTFTEAAAAEMRKRIGDTLQTMAEEAVSTGQVEASRRLARQIAQLDQAQISTLHSFCMQVVRQNYLRLEIDPAFDILSEEDALILKTAILEQVVEAKLSGLQGEESSDEVGDTHPFVQMVDIFGAGDPKAIFPLVFRLDTFARSQAEPTVWLDDITQNYEQAENRALTDLPWYGAFRDWCSRQLEDTLDGLMQARDLAVSIESMSAYVDNLNQAVPLLEAAIHSISDTKWDELVSQLAAISSLKSPRAKKSLDEEALEEVKEQMKKLRADALKGLKPVAEIVGRGIEALVADISGVAPAIRELIELIKEFQSAFVAEKRRRSQLDFNDLEHFAYDVLIDKTTGEAERLKEQYVEIFVDEFQDTSPIQDALVRAIARGQGNVFVVGDVKQSIYRFRMAEPGLFLDKYFGRDGQGHGTEGHVTPGQGAAGQATAGQATAGQATAGQATAGQATAGQGGDGQVGKFRPLYLSENYRSRREVVSAVNFVFSQLFSEDFGGAPYDDEAKMRFAARYPNESQPDDLSGFVEVHLIERDIQTSGDEDLSADETGNESSDKMADTTQPEDNGLSSQASGGEGTEGEPVSREDLLAIEREGEVIAARIHEWMGGTGTTPRQVWDAKQKTYRRLHYRDIVVLLRSVKGRMTPLLDIFRRHDIPAYGVTSTGFYGSLEIQWLLAALAAVDNPRREIELVATMRSPMGGFTDGELTDIRLLTKSNFYDAFRLAADTKGQHAALSVPLQTKARDFLHQLNGWRRLSRRSSTEAVLMRILEDSGLLDYLAAMTGGRVRVANVQTLLERVRAFDRSSVDGVFGFVTHARELLQHEVDLGEARTLAEAEDVVRIMTIHQSKGLEFPVVFVADLGKQFYRNPLERSLPLHRRMGFGPQRIDPVTDQRWRTMPSIAIEEAETTEFLAEEARILYVALTRARERLVLVGSARDLPKRIQAGATAAAVDGSVLPTRVLLRAKTSLDWLLPVLWRDSTSRSVLAHYTEELGDGAGARLPHTPRSDTGSSNLQQETVPKRGQLEHIPNIGLPEGSSNSNANRDGTATDEQERDDPRFLLQIWGLPETAEVVGSHSPDDALNLEDDGASLVESAPTSIAQPDDATAPTSTPQRDDATGRVPAGALLRAIEQGNHDDVIQLLAASEWYRAADPTSTEEVRMFSEPKVIGENLHKPSPPAKVSATELRRLWAARRQVSQATVFKTRGTAEHLLEDPAWVQQRKASGRERGLAFHSIMQVIDLSIAADGGAVRRELERLKAEGLITSEVSDAVNTEDITRFLNSGLGQALREALKTSGRLYREQPFFHRIDVGDTSEDRNFITVQGVMDCLAELEDKWLLVDYKTDNIQEEDAELTAEEYAAQISVYMGVAKSVIGSHKPLEAYVYFVHPAVAVPVRYVDVGSLFR